MQKSISGTSGTSGTPEWLSNAMAWGTPWLDSTRKFPHECLCVCVCALVGVCCPLISSDFHCGAAVALGRSECNLKRQVTVRVKRYSGKRHCSTGSRRITERSRFHRRSPAAVIAPTVMKTFAGQKQRGTSSLALFSSHPFCPRLVPSLHPSLL